jgi:hypothetical protein
MQRDIIVVDSFYDDPDAVVRYAMSLSYVFPYRESDFDKLGVPAWRASGWRPARSCPFKSSAALLAKLEQLTGEPIDREHWSRDFPLDDEGYPAPGFDKIERSCWWNCSFHVKHYSWQQVGEGVHSHTDLDIWNAVGLSGWVGLIYLNREAPREAGLRTWRNRDPAREFDWMTPAENWNAVDSLANEYNRLILHRGKLPHSGAAGWGTTLETGRLYQTFFFRTRSPAAVEPVTVEDLGLARC